MTLWPSHDARRYDLPRRNSTNLALSFLARSVVQIRSSCLVLIPQHLSLSKVALSHWLRASINGSEQHETMSGTSLNLSGLCVAHAKK